MPTSLESIPKLSLDEIEKITIAPGSHNDRSNGLCVMEIVAWVAACDAAGDALKPTTRRLQESAANLVRRMCAVGKLTGH